MNILLIMTDQHRVDHLGYDPRTRMATPNLDRIAQGTGFTNCWSTNPICQPARASLLTGKYSHQIGMLTMSGDLSLQHPTYPRALQAAGYHTAGIGKLHYFQGWDWFGKVPGSHRLAESHDQLKAYGFDTVWEAAGKLLSPRNRCDWMEHLASIGQEQAYRDHLKNCKGGDWRVNETTLDHVQPWPLDPELHIDSAIANRTCEEIDRVAASDQPFFIFASFCGPHQPYDPLPQHWAEYKDKPCDEPYAESTYSEPVRERLRELRRAYQAMVAGIDDHVGRLLNHLEHKKLLDSTVIIFTADHGEMLGDYGHLQKATPYWQSAQIPCAIRHPQYLHNQRSRTAIDLTDLTATILDIAGLDPQQALSSPTNWPSYHDRVPGHSLLPIVRGESLPNHESKIAFAECDAKWHDTSGHQPWSWQLLATDDWMYCRRFDRNKSPDQDWLHEYLWRNGDQPNQLVNHSQQHSDIIRQFRNRFDHLMTTTPPAQTSWAPLK